MSQLIRTVLLHTVTGTSVFCQCLTFKQPRCPSATQQYLAAIRGQHPNVGTAAENATAELTLYRSARQICSCIFYRSELQLT